MTKNITIRLDSSLVNAIKENNPKYSTSDINSEIREILNRFYNETMHNNRTRVNRHRYLEAIDYHLCKYLNEMTYLAELISLDSLLAHEVTKDNE